VTGAVALTAVLCLAQVLTMLGVFAFPALLPTFFAEWDLSNTDAGWIAGIYFAGYSLAVPVLSSLTDRVDARRVYMIGAVLAGVAAAGFALFAEGFWSAMVFRVFAGMGLAGTYMPGLRALTDRCEGPGQARAVAVYTACFSLATGLSFLMAGEVGRVFGWRAAFAVAAVATGLGMVLVAVALRPLTPQAALEPTRLLDFRPVLRNRLAMGYILGYAAHIWELFGFRSWLVVFLVFALSFHGQGGWPAPTTVATIGSLLAAAASIGGQELAMRLGRRWVVSALMLTSAVAAAGIGFTAPLPYGWVVVLAIAYATLMHADSAALTTGTVLAAEPGRRGATLALHSLCGFGAGFLGPLAVGIVLDLAGGTGSVIAWGLAFASMGIVVALGPLALFLLRQR
jgi:predicted MFS family arabinose efflux permease